MLAQFAQRGWLVIGTAFGFLMFCGGGLLLALTVMPLLYFVGRENAPQRCRAMLSFCCRIFLRMLNLPYLVDCRYEGAEKLLQPGILVVSNHPTLLDTPFLLARMPHAICVVKQSIWHHPLMGLPVKGAGYFSSDSGIGVMEEGQRRLAQGDALLIFAEGQRSTPGQPMTLQRGAANIAVRSGCPVLPVTIHSSEPWLIRGRRWYQVPYRQPHVLVRVGEPVDSNRFVNEQASLPLAARALTEHLRQYWTDELESGDVFR